MRRGQYERGYVLVLVLVVVEECDAGGFCCMFEWLYAG